MNTEYLEKCWKCWENESDIFIKGSSYQEGKKKERKKYVRITTPDTDIHKPENKKKDS